MKVEAHLSFIFQFIHPGQCETVGAFSDTAVSQWYLSTEPP